MKICAYMMLHQGKPYLRAALEAIAPQVDHIIILYTNTPSQGFGGELPCPDEEQELFNLAEEFEISWIHGRWQNEGAHHDTIWSFSGNYDWLVRLDADEVYPPGMVDDLIAQAEATEHKAYRVPIQHYWRSFSRVCRDGPMPVRLLRVKGGEGERYLDSHGWSQVIHHMGYAQPTRYIEYKLSVSGHRPEFRPDWLETRWKVNAQEDLHPVNFNFWNAESYDPALLPDVLKQHENFGKELIE